MLPRVRMTHANCDLLEIQQAALRLVAGGTDTASRGAAIAELSLALEHYERQGHFKE